MANIRCWDKKNRQRFKHEARNAAQKSAMRPAIKKLRAAIASKDGTQTQVLLKEATKLIARLGRRGIIERRTASRDVSRLTRAAAGKRQAS